MHLEDSFFPLEKKMIYFSLFGKDGFREIQFFINKEKFLLFTPLLEKLINKINPPLIFISIKPIKCESFSLGVNGNGFLLALNFLNGKKFIAFTKQLDKLFIKYNCQPNLSKNSYLKKSVAKKTICNYLTFKAKLKSFDPKKKFQSHFTRRIGL